MGIDFKKVKKQKPEELTEAQRSFEEHNKRSAQLMLDRGDTEYWFCICFSTEAELDEFKNCFGIDEQIISGIELREKTAGIRPKEVKRRFIAAKKYKASGRDIFKDVQYTGIFEIDCISELEEYEKALDSIEIRESYSDATESAYWICVYFASRDDKEEYLNEWGIKGYGDKYLDGSRWLNWIKLDKIG